MRLFELNDVSSSNNVVYVNSNYFPANLSIDVNLLVGSTFTRRVVSIDPSLATITSMVITWTSPNFIVFINCKLAARIGFADSTNLVYTMSLPYFKGNVVLTSMGGVLYTIVRQALMRSGCVGPDITVSTLSITTATTISSFPISTTLSVNLSNSGWFFLLF